MKILAKRCLAALLSMLLLASIASAFADNTEEYEAPRTVPASTGPHSALEATAYTGTSLARSTPEEHGISSEYILDLLDTIEKKNLEVHAMLIGVGEDVVYEAYYEPYGPGDIYQMNSMSKLYTCTAVGMAADRGLMNLEDYVKDVLAEYVTTDDENLGRLQLKHLLTMTGGHVAPVSYNSDDESWARSILAKPFDREPGSNFLYDGSCTILASTMLLKQTGLNTEQFLAENGFFSDFGYGNYYMALTPDGASSGAGGFKYNPEDLLKLGMMYLHGGVFNGKRILSEDWVNKSLGYDPVVTGQDQEQLGYKFHWYNKGQGYMYALGANGQTLFICPELDLTIATVGHINAIVQDVLVKALVKPLLADGENRNYDGASYQELLDRTAHLTLLDEITPLDSGLEETINGKNFSVSGNKSEITSVSLSFEDTQVALQVTDADGTYTILNGRNSYLRTPCEYVMHGNQLAGEDVVSRAVWLDENTLELRWLHMGSMYIDVWTFVFSEDGNSASLFRCDNGDYTGADYEVLALTAD